jgi:hypothetical protein
VFSWNTPALLQSQRPANVRFLVRKYIMRIKKASDRMMLFVQELVSVAAKTSVVSR